MSVVVDASVAVKWYIEEPGSAAARLLLGADELLVAPAHIEAEVGQALRRRVVGGDIGLTQALAAAGSLSDALVLVALSGISQTAIQIACEAGVSTYDALYVAAAIEWSAPLVTDDRRLREAIAKSGWGDRVDIRLLETQAP